MASLVDGQHKGWEVSEARSSMKAPTATNHQCHPALGCGSSVETDEGPKEERHNKERASRAARTDMMDIAIVATNRHLFPHRAPPKARPPETKKKTEVPIPTKYS